LAQISRGAKAAWCAFVIATHACHAFWQRDIGDFQSRLHDDEDFDDAVGRCMLTILYYELEYLTSRATNVCAVLHGYDIESANQPATAGIFVPPDVSG
jgi:hypothetical protein